MSDIHKIFQKYVLAIGTLQSVFCGQEKKPIGEESPDIYAFSTPTNTKWLREDLPPLAEVLLPTKFKLSTIITVYDYKVNLKIGRQARSLYVDCVSQETVTPESAVLPGTIDQFENFKKQVRDGIRGFPFDEVCRLLERLAAKGVPIDILLEIFLNKINVNNILEQVLPREESLKIVSFLFPEFFIQNLQGSSLECFEKEFCELEKRTVIFIFGFSDFLNSDLLAVCGDGHESELNSFIDKPSANDVLQKAKEAQKFRKSQGLWVYPTAWLTPDIFALKGDIIGTCVINAEIRRQFKSFCALLSAIFLADYVDGKASGYDEYRIEYKGYGRVSYNVDRTSLLEYESYLESLYKLYTYAYEGFSPDKLEIAQQFLSLIAVDLALLCEKATDVQDATKKTYEKALVEKVKGYFDARRQVQERLKTAVTETSKSVISLSRDVSTDLYKISGVIAGAVFGVLLKPDLSLWVALVASIVIAIYLGLVIFFHLETLQNSFRLRMDQHSAYIRSFKDILREEEIGTYLNDENFGKIQNMFFNRYEKAKHIYYIFLAVVLLFAIISLIMVLINASVLFLEIF